MKRVQRLSLAAALGCAACTGQTPDNFRFEQQEEAFGAFVEFNSKLDILWVVDNSGSMSDNQRKVRDGMRSFALAYMKPTWDIRSAVITTDAYLANASYTNYLSVTAVSGTGNYISNYLNGVTSGGTPGRSAPYVNPSWAPDLIRWDASVSKYRARATGVRITDMKPQYGPHWAQLWPGYHDGPQLAMCWEKDNMTNFLTSVTQCYKRDDPANAQYHTGVASCVTPNAGAGESSESQCVNTHMNNTVHSGKAMIETQPPAGTPADAAWQDQLVRDFMVNVSVSIVGDGSERGMQSVLQFIADNESDSALKFFRPDSLRLIVFVTDEEDYTMYPDPNQITPTSHYGTTGCRVTDASGVTYGETNCPQPAWWMPVSEIKASFDSFFSGINEPGFDDPNYFVAAIVQKTGTGPRGMRYVDLVKQVGRGSLEFDIQSADYTPLLDSIGQQILARKASFTLKYEVTNKDWMIVTIEHSDGTTLRLRSDQFEISGRTLTITDLAVVSSLSHLDKVVINYQPSSI